MGKTASIQSLICHFLATDRLPLGLIVQSVVFRVWSLQTQNYDHFCLRDSLKWSEVAQSCLTLCNPMDCSLPGSSVHGIFQEIVLGWVAIFFSRGSSQPRDWAQVSHIVDRHFTVWTTRNSLEALFSSNFSICAAEASTEALFSFFFSSEALYSICTTDRCF